MPRKLRMGLIGGGPGSFIGRIHRIAAELDGEAQLVCGAFSSTPERSREAGDMYHLPASRVYASYQQMIDVESTLSPGERMDFVAIVTPNHLHFDAYPSPGPSVLPFQCMSMPAPWHQYQSLYNPLRVMIDR